METEEVRLTSATIIRLAKLRAQIDVLRKEENELCCAIKDRMVEKEVDEFRPMNSPFKAVLLEYKRSLAPYRLMAIRAYKTLHGAAWKVRFNNDKDAFGQKPVSTLLLRPNENYRDGARTIFSRISAVRSVVAGRTRKIRLPED